MRVNFLALAAITFLAGLMQVVNRDPWLGGAMIAMSVVLAVLHFVRVRRFKSFDQSRTFD